MALLQDVVTSIRTLRSEWGVPTSRKVCAIIESASKDDEALLEASREQVSRLAGLDKLEFAVNVQPDPDTVRRVVRNFRVHVPMAGIVDRGKEVERVKRELAKLSKQRNLLQSRLANSAFVERAAPAVVVDAKNQEETIGQRQAQLEQILTELNG